MHPVHIDTIINVSIKLYHSQKKMQLQKPVTSHSEFQKCLRVHVKPRFLVKLVFG